MLNRYYALLTVFLIVGVIQYQVIQTGNQIFTNCASGQILKNQTGTWLCADDLTGAGAANITYPWLYIQTGNITYNETNLNTTIQRYITGVTYNASSITVSAGTINYGDINSIKYLQDGKNISIQEANSASPIDVRINITGVEGFDNILTDQYYLGSTSHQIEYELWNYVLSSWETYYTITGENEYVTEKIAVLDSADHISADASKTVQLRMLHIQNGIISHILYIDYAALQKGFTGLTLNQHDALSGLQNYDTNHPLYAKALTAVKSLWLNDSTAIYSNASISSGNVKIMGNLTIKGIVKANITCIGSACMYQNGSGYLFYTNPCAITDACA